MLLPVLVLGESGDAPGEPDGEAAAIARKTLATPKNKRVISSMKHFYNKM